MRLSIRERFVKKKLSITKRIYIWTSIIICITIIIVILFSGLNAVKLNQLEYERDLVAITGQLGNHLNQSFDDLLRLKGVADEPSEQQLLILNSELQPIVNLIGEDYPKFALGFFSAKLDRNVAVVPNKGVDKLVPIPHSRPFFKVYETKQPMLIKVYTSSIWGIPTLSYTNPIFDRNGVMIGHAWANITLREMYKALLIHSLEILGIGLISLALVLLILKKLFNRLNKEINDLATAIVNNDNEIKEYLLPELKPVINKIRNHITEMNQLQAEMARLDRLNLVGQMAAGIAHEIRNPMTTVRGYLQLLGAKSEFQPHASAFELMIQELDRANSIITEFLSIVKNSPPDRQCQNINEILQRLYPLLEADAFTQSKQIAFEAGETPDILLNAKEISQLLLNLCRNGLEAMQVGGTLTIRTYIEDDHVVLCVEDEGGGIPSEYLEKIGTPFFTTKDNGTGLGLATCYSIADRHDATIDLNSGSSGTTFFVRFPCLSVNQ